MLPRRWAKTGALVLGLVGAAACGSETLDGGVGSGAEPPTTAAQDASASGEPRDAGAGGDGAAQTDGPATWDGAPERDGGAGDGATDAGPLDPRTCAVGPADGCCPLAIVHGGTDPDCRPLDCAVTTKGDPIPIYVPEPAWRGQIAAAWSGRELVLARAVEVFENLSNVADLVVQRRDAAGAVVGPDAVRRLASLPPGATWAELAIDPSGDLFFAWQWRQDQLYRLARLPAAGGAPTWTSALGYGCNAVGGSLHLFPDGARIVAGMAQYTCAGSTWQPLVQVLSAASGASAVTPGKEALTDLRDGARSDMHGGGGFAFHPATHALDVAYGRNFEDDLRMRTLDLVAETLSTPQQLVVPAADYHTALAYDGANHALVTRERSTSGATTSYMLRLLGATGITATQSLASFGRDTDALTPRVLYTGDSYVVLVPYVVGFTQNTSPERLSHRTRVFRVSKAGALLESFELDASPSMFATVVRAGTRLAFTFMRPSGPGGTTSQGFLRYLGCGS
jgi:hypothetical protein